MREVGGSIPPVSMYYTVHPTHLPTQDFMRFTHHYRFLRPSFTHYSLLMTGEGLNTALVTLKRYSKGAPTERSSMLAATATRRLVVNLGSVTVQTSNQMDLVRLHMKFELSLTEPTVVYVINRAFEGVKAL